MPASLSPRPLSPRPPSSRRPSARSSASLSIVIFDVDGTLIDSQHHIHAAMVAAFATCGLAPPTLAAVRSIVGLSLPVAIARLAPADAPVADLVAAYKTFFAARRSRDMAPMYAGARDCLDRLAGHARMLLGVATGKSRRGLDLMIEMHDLHGRFVTLQTADGNPSKPHPGMLLKALAETGMDPGRAVMIGDTGFDMAMARAAGMQAWGVGWGYHAVPMLHEAGANRVFADFASLSEALDRWHEGEAA